MSRYLGFPDQPDAHARTAVLLLNLGTPAAPTADAVGDYLSEFLSDPRIVESPRWLWWPVLHGYILRTRPRRSAEAYAKVLSPMRREIIQGAGHLPMLERPDAFNAILRDFLKSL